MPLPSGHNLRRRQRRMPKPHKTRRRSACAILCRRRSGRRFPRNGRRQHSTVLGGMRTQFQRRLHSGKNYRKRRIFLHKMPLQSFAKLLNVETIITVAARSISTHNKNDFDIKTTLYYKTRVLTRVFVIALNNCSKRLYISPCLNNHILNCLINALSFGGNI